MPFDVLDKMIGDMTFVLFVCPPVDFAITCTILRDKDFIFGLHTQLMKPFQMTQRSLATSDSVAARGIVFREHILLVPYRLAGGTLSLLAVCLSVSPSVSLSHFSFPDFYLRSIEILT